MKWNKKEDTFTLTREELADVMDFVDHWEFVAKKEQPEGWSEFRTKTYIPLNRLMGLYARRFRKKK